MGGSRTAFRVEAMAGADQVPGEVVWTAVKQHTDLKLKK